MGALMGVRELTAGGLLARLAVVLAVGLFSCAPRFLLILHSGTVPGSSQGTRGGARDQTWASCMPGGRAYPCAPSAVVLTHACRARTLSRGGGGHWGTPTVLTQAWCSALPGHGTCLSFR